MKKKLLTHGLTVLVWSIFFIKSSLFAQVTTDETRPFNQGQVSDVPGSTDYLGDIPHQISFFNASSPYHTLTGLTATEVGWTTPGQSSPSLYSNSGVGIFFEDIPYPFPSANILNWMPAVGNFELLEFPAGAWWGPGASMGAVQLQTPILPEKQQVYGGVWSGSGGHLGGVGDYQSKDFSFSGNYQDDPKPGSNSTETLSALSKINWFEDGTFKFQSNFLGSQNFMNDSWYSFFSSLEIATPNFQTFQIKPFVQSAQLDGQTVQEIGSHFQYQLNMAGLFESHLLAGWSHDYFGSYSNSENSTKEFLQNTETFDVLGFANGDLAFRLDFLNESETIFDSLFGLQSYLGDFVVRGDFGNNTLPITLKNYQQLNLGFLYQPEDVWGFSCKYVHENIEGVSWNGGRADIHLNHDSPFLAIFKKLKIELSEQSLLEQGGMWSNDFGAKLQTSFSNQDSIWVKAREVTYQPLFSEIGADYFFRDGFKIFISVANLNNLPVSWPDPNTSEGRVFWLGIEING